MQNRRVYIVRTDRRANEWFELPFIYFLKYFPCIHCSAEKSWERTITSNENENGFYGSIISWNGY